MKTNLKKIVKLGYISDYKFKKNLEDSKLLREKLKKKGVEYVIGFFDQGYFKDKLFGVGYHVSSFGYKFLLEKVIQNENIGLIIKPKKPKYLEQKLSNNYEILKSALKTERVILLDQYPDYHSKNFEDNPAKIAFASDITIDDTVMAGTAGLESALTGCKSVFFDYYFSGKTQFENNDLNIVFRDWEKLWYEIVKDINKQENNLGKWDKIINKFDNFKDGKTNLRIIKFLSNQIEI